jgi:hypothetical protein
MYLVNGLLYAIIDASVTVIPDIRALSSVVIYIQ